MKAGLHWGEASGWQRVLMQAVAAADAPQLPVAAALMRDAPQLLVAAALTRAALAALMRPLAALTRAAPAALVSAPVTAAWVTVAGMVADVAAAADALVYL
jgi:hypothetical protein